MKPLILALTALFAFQLQSGLAAPAEEESRFLAAAKQAFAKQDVEAVMALVCWDRVPQKFKASRTKQYPSDLAKAPTDITLPEPHPDSPAREWKDKDGVSYRTNLPV